MKDALNNSIAKAMTILNCFSYEKPRLRLKEISLMTGISQPTVYRMLNTLKEYKLIEQSDSIYSLGLGFLKYEGIVINSLEIRSIALPLLEELASSLKVTTNLAVLDEDDCEVVYVARVDAPQNFYGYFHAGMRRPIHCTALGKVLTCQSPELIQKAFQKEIRRYTLHTITSLEPFLDEVEKVRLQGYGADLEEWSNGINCLAAPIFSASGKIVAGISISGPTSTHPVELLLSYVPQLIEFAARISSRLGFRNGL